MGVRRLVTGLCVLALPVLAWAGPPSPTEAKQAVRSLLIEDGITIDRVARGPNSFTNPTPADLKRDEAIRQKYEKMDIFIGEINKESGGLYSVVYGVGDTTSTAWLIQGAKGWKVKCYQTNSGQRRCK